MIWHGTIQTVWSEILALNVSSEMQSFFSVLMILEYCICNDKQDISIHLQIHRKQSHSSEGQTNQMLFLLQFPWHMDGVLGILLLVLILSMDISALQASSFWNYTKPCMNLQQPPCFLKRATMQFIYQFLKSIYLKFVDTLGTVSQNLFQGMKREITKVSLPSRIMDIIA